MKTLSLKPNLPQWLHQLLLWLSLLLLLLLLIQLTNRYQLPMAWLDPSIWQLFALSLLSYFGSLSLSFGLLSYGLRLVNLPRLIVLLADFKKLNLMQQFCCYWASFALLFLGFLLSLAAIF